MNTKKIYCISHIDFDGAIAPFIIEQLTALNNDFNYEVKINYCEFYDFDKVFIRTLEQIDSIDMCNTYLLFTDLVFLDEKYAAELDIYKQKGLNLLYIDHHVSNRMEKLQEKYDWVYYSDNLSKCASMQLMLIILSAFKKKLGINMEEYTDKYLKIKENEIKDYIEYELNNIWDIKNVEQFIKFIEGFLNLSSNRTIDEYRNYLSKVLLLVWAANLVDHGNLAGLDGLRYIISYYDIANEYINKTKNEILFYLMDILNTWSGSISIFKNDLQKLENEFYVNKRIELSFDSIRYYKIFDRENNEYLFGVVFGEGDLIFVVDSFRNRVKNDKLYGFISFTRISISDTPIFQVRTSNTDTLNFIDRAKKDADLAAEGSNVGIRGLFEKEIYDRLVILRREIIQSNNEKIIKDNKAKIDAVIEEEMNRIFYRACQVQLFD